MEAETAQSISQQQDGRRQETIWGPASCVVRRATPKGCLLTRCPFAYEVSHSGRANRLRHKHNTRKQEQP
jgi:hypothetical protein